MARVPTVSVARAGKNASGREADLSDTPSAEAAAVPMEPANDLRGADQNEKKRGPTAAAQSQRLEKLATNC